MTISRAHVSALSPLEDGDPWERRLESRFSRTHGPRDGEKVEPPSEVVVTTLRSPRRESVPVISALGARGVRLRDTIVMLDPIEHHFRVVMPTHQNDCHFPAPPRQHVETVEVANSNQLKFLGVTIHRPIYRCLTIGGLKAWQSSNTNTSSRAKKS